MPYSCEKLLQKSSIFLVFRMSLDNTLKTCMSELCISESQLHPKYFNSIFKPVQDLSIFFVYTYEFHSKFAFIATTLLCLYLFPKVKTYVPAACAGESPHSNWLKNWKSQNRLAIVILLQAKIFNMPHSSSCKLDVYAELQCFVWLDKDVLSDFTCRHQYFCSAVSLSDRMQIDSVKQSCKGNLVRHRDTGGVEMKIKA